MPRRCNPCLEEGRTWVVLPPCGTIPSKPTPRHVSKPAVTTSVENAHRSSERNVKGQEVLLVAAHLVEVQDAGGDAGGVNDADASAVTSRADL